MDFLAGDDNAEDVWTVGKYTSLSVEVLSVTPNLARFMYTLSESFISLGIYY